MKMLTFALFIGVPTLLLLGAIYNVLSLREWAIGMVTCFAMVLLWASALKRAVKKKRLASGAEPRPALDDSARKLMLRDIRNWKVWIGVLIALLPVGIANGVAHRAWLPTLGGIGISLWLMYAGIRQIRLWRKKLDSTR